MKPSTPVANKKFPARLHVLIARQAKVGLVIRRGPSTSVCTVLWNRERDTFKIGQWMRGRIYDRRSDLSPDGKHLIYFAMNGRWESETKGAWTAICRVPYLNAINLFAKGDCWHGERRPLARACWELFPAQWQRWDLSFAEKEMPNRCIPLRMEPDGS